MVQPKKEVAFIICKTNAPILPITIIRIKIRILIKSVIGP
ncbi:hypothetical protein [Bacillus bingmayongensis]